MCYAGDRGGIKKKAFVDTRYHVKKKVIISNKLVWTMSQINLVLKEINDCGKTHLKFLITKKIICYVWSTTF